MGQGGCFIGLMGNAGKNGLELAGWLGVGDSARGTGSEQTRQSEPGDSGGLG